MSPDLDLRPLSREDRRRRISDALDDAERGETVAVAAASEPDVFLHWYGIKRDRRLDWTVEESDDGVVVEVTKGDSLDGDLTEFDVRDMPPQRRHEVLTDTFDALDPGEGFVLVNDHDPKPLYHELRSTRGETFEWEYESRDSDEWRVSLVKTDATESAGEEVAASFDVREIPKSERHPTIHHRYGNLSAGDAMEIVAPHEPRPLHREFSDRYGEAFEWDVVESEPGRCRVRITKGADRSDDADPSEAPSSPSKGSVEAVAELDVRDLPPAKRHERIFERYDGLDAGEGFVLVNDHDPKPLYHQFEAEAGDEFRWEYVQQEPGEFRVLIGKAGGSSDALDAGSTTNETPDAPF